MTPAKKKEIVLWLAAALLLGAAWAYGAERLPLAPPMAGDLVPGRLAAAALPVRPGTDERAPVAFSWALGAEAGLAAAPSRLHAESREYWQRVSAAELAAGVDLFTTAPGALVRLQPAGPEAAKRTVDPADFVLVDDAGRARESAEAMDRLATAEQLAAAGALFAEGTSAFRLKAELGAGRFVLRAAAASGDYVVHVFDAESDLALVVDGPRVDYLAGEALAVAAYFTSGDGREPAEALSGFVTSPSGQVRPARFRRAADGTFRLRLPLAGERAGGTDGLFEVVASARGRKGTQVALRTVRGAFAVATPTARLAGGAERLAGESGELTLRFPIEAAAAGRFEVRGVLHGRTAGGEEGPVAVAHAAAWLEPGARHLDLTFDAAALSGVDRAAPFSLRAVELHDQTRLGVLERRQGGVEIPR